MIEDEIVAMERRCAELVRIRDPITRELLTLRSQLRLARARAAREAALDYPRPNRKRPIKRRTILPHEQARRLRATFYDGETPRAGR